jgi:hypothetical protein
MVKLNFSSSLSPKVRFASLPYMYSSFITAYKKPNFVDTTTWRMRMCGISNHAVPTPYGLGICGKSNNPGHKNKTSMLLNLTRRLGIQRNLQNAPSKGKWIQYLEIWRFDRSIFSEHSSKKMRASLVTFSEIDLKVSMTEVSLKYSFCRKRRKRKTS